MKIRKIKARQILDSRGNPTVECDVIVESNSEKVKNKSYGASGGLIKGTASVPSGASTGSHEAVELRDGEMVHFWGKGVLRAVENIEEVIGPALQEMDVSGQKKIDERMMELDGTENKSKLGANAILAVSLACARAASEAEGKELFEYLHKLRSNSEKVKSKVSATPFYGWDVGEYRLPVPFMNVINGGRHAVNGVDFQEFMIVPHGFGSFAEALESGTEVFMKLKEMLHKDGFSTTVGDEGGFAPQFKRNEEALEYLMRAIESTGFKPGEEIGLAMDAAASELGVKSQESRVKTYELRTEGRSLTTEQMIDYWVELVKKYPIVSLEDPLGEDDWEGWKNLSSKFKVQSSKLQIVGDDLLVTNPIRLQRAIDEQACNAILIKLNQIGTLTETIDVINLAHENGFNCMVSHRSGETEDTFIADLAVGMGCGQIKAGSLSRSERVVKYNRLLRIEEKLKSKV